jgi:hypothetical protein
MSGSGGFKLFLIGDYLMVLFVAMAVGAFYTLGGVISLVLVLVSLVFLSLFVAMVKGPDILIIYTVISLFVVVLGFLAGGVAGIVVTQLVSIFVALRGLAKLSINLRNIAVIAATVAGSAAVYALIPYPYTLLSLGAAALASLAMLFYVGRVSPLILKLFFSSPREGFHILRSRIKSAWQIGAEALTLAEAPAPERGEVGRPVPPPPPPPPPPEAPPSPPTHPTETVSQEKAPTPSFAQPQPAPAPAAKPIDESIANLVKRYYSLLATLETSYKEGKIRLEVYEKLKAEYVGKLKQLGYEPANV